MTDLTPSECRVLVAYVECRNDTACAAGKLSVSVAYINRVLRRIRKGGGQRNEQRGTKEK